MVTQVTVLTDHTGQGNTVLSEQAGQGNTVLTEHAGHGNTGDSSNRPYRTR